MAQWPAKGPLLKWDRQRQAESLQASHRPPAGIDRRKREPTLFGQPTVQVNQALPGATGAMVGDDQHGGLGTAAVQQFADGLIQGPVHREDGAAPLPRSLFVVARRIGIVECPEMMRDRVRLTIVHKEAVPRLAIQQICCDLGPAAQGVEHFAQRGLMPRRADVYLLEIGDLVRAHSLPDFIVQLGRVHKGPVNAGGDR